nr:hypothetical protein Iba_chr09cCG10760 [Ipomoea batatas]
MCLLTRATRYSYGLPSEKSAVVWDLFFFSSVTITGDESRHPPPFSQKDTDLKVAGGNVETWPTKILPKVHIWPFAFALALLSQHLACVKF